MARSRPFRILRGILLGAVTLVLVAVGVALYAWYVAPVDTVGKVDFNQPLRVPDLVEPDVGEDGVSRFRLEAQEGETILRPGENPSDTWGFNGSYLGPTLHMQRGDDVEVELVNALDEATTVHWHGMHLPAEMDGGPHQMVQPGETWTPRWTVDQPAGTLWYHPHPHGETEEHVYRGLAGMIWVDDPASAVAARMPHEYGVDDVPLIVQDVKLDDGQLMQGSGFLSQSGKLGDEILVNGTYGPYLDVTTEAVRLRLLNASTARVFDFGFSDDRSFDLVGTDGGMLASPVPLTRLMLSPGERADVVVRMTAGETVTLRSYPPDIKENLVSERFDGGKDRFDVLELRAAEELASSPALPSRLGPAPDLAEAVGDEVDRTFTLSGRSINGEKMDMDRIDEVVELDTPEVWEIHNRDGGYHNFHVHDVQFEVLSVDGAEPPPELSGWKDTVLVRPGETIRIALGFTDYADPDSPYMYHCHMLMHEDRGMMGQFVVVEPGTAVDRQLDGDSSDHGGH